MILTPEHEQKNSSAKPPLRVVAISMDNRKDFRLFAGPLTIEKLPFVKRVISLPSDIICMATGAGESGSFKSIRELLIKC
jgi:hypothetical protein